MTLSIVDRLIMLVYFAVIATLGVMSIVQTPHILLAFSPTYAVEFFLMDPVRAFLALGSVVLAMTGAEALVLATSTAAAPAPAAPAVQAAPIAPLQLAKIERKPGAERPTKPVDFRKGMDGLAALIAAELKLEPYSGVIYVFRSKRADRVKLLFWDGTGVCLLAKRLEGGKFRWPKVANGVMRLSPAQLSALLEGLDWSRVHAQRVARPTAAQ